MKTIDDYLLDKLTSIARQNPRLRQNHNLHEDYEDPCQRLINAIEPGSYIRPHRHLDPPRPETFVVLRGRLAAIIFREDGCIERVAMLTAGGQAIGVDIPPGVWHTVLSMEIGTIFFETKSGPYRPLCDKDWAPWAPMEGSAEARDYLQRLSAFCQNRGRGGRS